MLSFLALIPSKVKRYLLIGGAVLVTLGIVALKLINIGVQSEKTKQAETSLDNLRTRMKVDAEVDSSNIDAIRDELRDDWTDK